MDAHDNPLGVDEHRVQQEAGLNALRELSRATARTGPLPLTRRGRRHKPRPGVWRATAIAATAVTVLGIGGAWWASGPVQTRPAAARLYQWPAGQMPVGVTLSSMQAYVMTSRVLRTVEHQEWSARFFWHANTVRLQLLQDRLVGTTGRRLARWYLNDIRQVTDYGLRQGLTVVLNAQTELAMGYAHNESVPDKVTLAFWRALLPYYAHNPHVVFDLFNEPRRTTWGDWQPAYQNLITALRRDGSANQLWVEGINWGATLEGVPLLHDPRKPRGYPGIVYTFHHPGAPWPWQAPVTEAEWHKAFGYLAEQGIPVVDAEFANYTGSYDWAYPELPGANPGRLVTQYLRYLARDHIGMMAWSLVPGALNSGLSFTSVAREPQGDGQLIKSWLLHENHHYTHSRYWARFQVRNSRDLRIRDRIIRRYCTPYGGIPKRLQHYIRRCPHRG